MSTPSGLFRGSRALLAAAKSTAARSAAVATKVTPAPESSKSNVPKTESSKSKVPKSSKSNVPKTESSKSKVSKKSKVSGAGITKALPISPALQSFVGSPEISRSEAVKKIWEHIKAHNLQKNPSDKREIFCDDTLKKILDGRDKVTMLELAKLLSAHFVKN